MTRNDSGLLDQFRGFWGSQGHFGHFHQSFEFLKVINYHRRSDLSNHRGLICLWPPKFSGCQNGVSTTTNCNVQEAST